MLVVFYLAGGGGALGLTNVDGSGYWKVSYSVSTASTL